MALAPFFSLPQGGLALVTEMSLHAPVSVWRLSSFETHSALGPTAEGLALQ